MILCKGMSFADALCSDMSMNHQCTRDPRANKV